MDEQMRTTSFDQLLAYARGTLVELPEFDAGMPLFVRMRRPSMLDLMAKGRIPNPLAHTATSIFSKGGKGIDQADPQQMKDLTEILHIFCEVSFVEPTYSQIKEAGLELTDEQLMFVFNYVQAGNKALEKFRRKQESAGAAGDVAAVQEEAVGVTGYN